MLKLLTIITKIGLVLCLVGLIIAGYLVWYFSHDLPDYSQLKEYHPPCVTRIYSADGKLIEEYAKEKRIFVPISSVPKSLVYAFIAAEDKNFYDHVGIDIFSILRASIANVSHLMNNTRFEGGSTITQQVVKNFLLTSERSIERKVKEAILSYMISQVLSKEQILELYLNQTFLGKGAYGVAAAALVYFNKSVEELSISESALLASLPKAPSKYSPDKNYDRALARRNYVIGRMYDDGYITEEQARKAIAEPIKLIKQDVVSDDEVDGDVDDLQSFNAKVNTSNSGNPVSFLPNTYKMQNIDADYYAEQVRSEVIGMFSEEYFYTAGLTIITCADSKIQKSAADALRYGIKAYDMKMGYRGALKNISLDNWHKDLAVMPNPVGLRDYKLAVVLNVEDLQAKIGMQNGKTVFIKLSDMAWTKTNLKSVKQLLKIGDVIVVEKAESGYKLQQIPSVNGGIMVVEPHTGRVLAAEGGYDYDISKFDRTTQAQRQPGSLIKPFVYFAALEKGVQPNDVFEDAYIEIPLGPGMPVWKPKNWDNSFMGSMTVRRGLEKSRNTITVRVGKIAGVSKIAETLKIFGINDNPAKVPSIVLGALETTLERMTMAYSIFANKGRKVTPHYIELIKDRKGNVLYRRDYAECVECRDYKKDVSGNPLPPIIPTSVGQIVADDAACYQITSILAGAIQNGTGQAAKVLQKVIAGKTGTSNEGKDTWFIGFTPKILVGTYIGYDTPKTLGKRATGATVALPVFIEFMKNGYKDVPSVDFEVPDSVELISIDHHTGQVSTGKGSIMEAFRKKNYERLENNDKAHDDETHYGRETQLPDEIVEVQEEDSFDPFLKINTNGLETHDPSQEVY